MIKLFVPLPLLTDLLIQGLDATHLIEDHLWFGEHQLLEMPLHILAQRLCVLEALQ
jgi:hypothetical protein